MKTINDMWEQIDSWISCIKNEQMRKDLSFYMYHHRDKFVVTPGSIKHHHAYEGGLLEHTIETTHIAHGIMKVLFHGFPEKKITLPKFSDEVIFTALIHDIGKINDYAKNTRTGKWEYFSLKSNHSWFVVKDWEKQIREPLDKEIAHAILTHHGGWSKTGRDLNSLLSAVIHGADLISSRMTENDNETTRRG